MKPGDWISVPARAAGNATRRHRSFEVQFPLFSKSRPYRKAVKAKAYGYTGTGTVNRTALEPQSSHFGHISECSAVGQSSFPIKKGLPKQHRPAPGLRVSAFRAHSSTIYCSLCFSLCLIHAFNLCCVFGVGVGLSTVAPPKRAGACGCPPNKPAAASGPGGRWGSVVFGWRALRPYPVSCLLLAVCLVINSLTSGKTCACACHLPPCVSSLPY